MDETRRIPPDVISRAEQIRLLLMDVDGTLTDGRVYLQSFSDGTAEELKAFDAHDGAGLTLAHIMGLQTGVITGRESAAMTRRARELKMDFVYQGRSTKIGSYDEILQRAGLEDVAVAYVGDDLPDIPLLRRAGLAVAVGNAVPEVKSVAHYITSRDGGRGAVREVVELILKAQKKWKEAVPKALA
jgi:3-deoxy-D-manno-octulosonate 8-phosphate phosphatase (KDO 8-P phosphatase)